MLRPRCRWRVYRNERQAHQQRSAADVCRSVTPRRCSGARIDTALPGVNPYRERICASIRWRVRRCGIRRQQLSVGLFTAGGSTASALAAGCPVVVKAHPGHMATAEQTAQAIVRAVEEMPPCPAGCSSMIFGVPISGPNWCAIRRFRRWDSTGSLTRKRYSSWRSERSIANSAVCGNVGN